jgi:hypothetical protein
VHLAIWPTPTKDEAGGTPEQFLERKRKLDGKCGVSLTALNLVAQLAAWPTPMAGTPAQNGYNEAGNNDSSRKTVALASWATPSARDFKSNEGSEEFHRNRAEQSRGKPLSEQAHQLAAWPTARMTDGEKNVRTMEGSAREIARKGSPQDLNQAATLAAWPSPQARDGAHSRSGQPERTGGQRRNLDDYATLAARLTASGPTPNGSPAQTEKPGQLDPDHSRWVMGYQTAHLSCAPTETPSSLKSRRNLSWPPRRDG